MSLDDALAAWAATVQLPDAIAVDIYERIVAAPEPGLDVRWWRQYTLDFTTRMVASTQPLRWAA